MFSASTTPLAPSQELLEKNPLAKIPALVLEDGEALFDSHVIVDHLDALAGGGRIIPREGEDRRRALRLEALADGVLDAGILVHYERRFRAPDKVDEAWCAAQAAKVRSALASLDRDVARLDLPLDLGTISLGCALGWLEFRDPIPGLRAQHPALFAWWDRLRARASFSATEPRS